jgi:hypothetical protein
MRIGAPPRIRRARLLPFDWMFGTALARLRSRLLNPRQSRPLREIRAPAGGGGQARTARRV